MALRRDYAPKFQDYAHPQMLVTTDWVAAHAWDPGLVVAESDEDVLLYDTGHIPGAVKLDWYTELNDPVNRDYIDGAAFARLMSEKGITRDSTLVLYGDNNNWWAAHALWVCELFGHPDVRLMDGGRAKWIAEGRPLATDVPQPLPPQPPPEHIDVLAHLSPGATKVSGLTRESFGLGQDPLGLARESFGLARESFGLGQESLGLGRESFDLAWESSAMAQASTGYPVIERDDTKIRALLDQVVAHLGNPLIDVRSPLEYTGELIHIPGHPREGALRGGHIPGARNVPWSRAAADDGTFRTRRELETIYQDEVGLRPDDDVVVYGRIGERSSHTWFVLHHLLGYPKVRNYDGSWTEWGNSVRAPIVRGGVQLFGVIYCVGS